jgi:hypothetical protein
LGKDLEILDDKPALLALAVSLAFEQDLSPEGLVLELSQKEGVLD